MNLRASGGWGEERRLRALLAATGLIGLRLSADGRTLARIAAAGPEGDWEGDLSGWIERRVAAGDRARVAETLARALPAGEPFDIEVRLAGEGSEARWLRFRLAPLRGPSGAVEEWLAAGEDVTALRRAEDAAQAREERLRLALDIAGLSTWDWDLPSGRVVWSEGHFALQGYAPGEVTPSYEAWAARVHPEDLPETEARLRDARDSGAPYVGEFRVLPGEGATRWCRARGRFLRDGAGRPVRMIGVMQDVTAAHEAEQRQRALLSELQHRVRNNLAVVRSIVRRSARSAEQVEDFAAQLEGRIGALARVQSATTRSADAGMDLEAMVRDELQLACPGDGRCTVEGPALRLPLRTAEILTLAFHELAANALEHGALAGPDGRIAVRWAVELDEPPVLRLRWEESADVGLGPRGPDGFGTELLERVLPYNLGARSRLEIRPEGLLFEIELPLPAP